MLQEDFLALLGRLYERQTNFQGRHAPRAGVADRFVEHDGIVELHQFAAARRPAAADERNIFGAFVAVDEQAELRLADIAFFAGRDEDAEIVGQPGLGFAAVADFALVARRRCASRLCRRFRYACRLTATFGSPRARLRCSGCSGRPRAQVLTRENSRSHCASASPACRLRIPRIPNSNRRSAVL